MLPKIFGVIVVRRECAKHHDKATFVKIMLDFFKINGKGEFAETHNTLRSVGWYHEIIGFCVASHHSFFVFFLFFSSENCLQVTLLTAVEEMLCVNNFQVSEIKSKHFIFWNRNEKWSSLHVSEVEICYAFVISKSKCAIHSCEISLTT